MQMHRPLGMLGACRAGIEGVEGAFCAWQALC